MKVEKNQIRTIVYADPYFTHCGAALIANIVNFVKAMESDKLWPFRYGGTFSKGRVSYLWGDILDYAYRKGDCDKWDAGVSDVLFSWEYHCFKHFMPEQYHPKLKWYFQHTAGTYVLLPTGLIIWVVSQMSGDYKTTIGNCFGHLLPLIDHFLDHYRQFRENPYVEWKHIHFSLYADDHLNAYPKYWEKCLSYDTFIEYYERCGQRLHADQDHVQIGPVGMTFLGAKIVSKYGDLEPEFPLERLLAIFLCNNYEKDLDGVIPSVAPLFRTNPLAWSILLSYTKVFAPAVYPMLLGTASLSGRESLPKEVGGNKMQNEMVRRNRSRKQGQRAPKTQAVRQQTTTVVTRPVRQNPRPRVVRTTTMVKNTQGPSNRRRGASRSISHAQVRSMTAYVQAIVDPANATEPYLPSCNTQPTAIYRGRQIINLQPWDDPTSLDDGRFYVLVKPVITRVGAATPVPGHMQCKCLVNNIFRAGTTWTSPFQTSGTVPQNNFIVIDDPEGNNLIPDAASQFGTIETAAVVGMSLYITYEGSTLNDGGAIAIAQVPYTSFRKEFSGNTPGGSFNNNIINWERLSSLPGNYNGRVSKGAYCYWRPTGDTHRLYYDVLVDAVGGGPIDWQAVNYPLIMCSGKLDRGTGTGLGRLRAQIDLIVQYTTTSQVPGAVPRPIDCNAIMFADALLRDYPQAMENPGHEARIANIMRTAAALALGFLTGGRLGAGLAGLASLGLTLPSSAPSYLSGPKPSV